MMKGASARLNRSPRALRLAAALCILCALATASGCSPRQQSAASAPLAEGSFNEAVSAYQSGDCRPSILRFNAALARGEHPAFLNGLGMASLECNQPQNAVRAFERAIAVAPGSAALHANAGTALYAASDYDGAEKQFTTALRLDPANPEAIVGKAGLFIEKKQPEKALQTLSQLAGTDAAAPEVLYNKALALYQMGLLDDAGSGIAAYARAHPDDAEAQNALGVVMLHQKDYASAKAHLDRAIALRPEQGNYYYNRANILKEQKQFREAVEDYGRAIAFTPDMAAAYVNRGDVRFLLRDTENACADLKKACDLGQCDRLEKYEEAGRCRDFF